LFPRGWAFVRGFPLARNMSCLTGWAAGEPLFAALFTQAYAGGGPAAARLRGWQAGWATPALRCRQYEPQTATAAASSAPPRTLTGGFGAASAASTFGVGVTEGGVGAEAMLPPRRSPRRRRPRFRERRGQGAAPAAAALAAAASAELALGRGGRRRPAAAQELRPPTLPDRGVDELCEPPPPRYPGAGEVTPEFLSRLAAFLHDGGLLPWEDVAVLVADATEIFKVQKTVEPVAVPVGEHLTVVGDLHGQYWDLLSIFHANGQPSPRNPYLFNGDIVDRGSFSVETLLLLLACKVAFPAHVHIARGNHESHEMNVAYGFAGEVLSKYDENAYVAFQRLFVQLPLAHVVNSEVFIVHGGLPRVLGIRLADIQAVDRVLASQATSRLAADPGLDTQILTDLLWSDPRPHESGFKQSRRGPGIKTFGADVTNKFLGENGLSLLIRSHECKSQGFEWHHDGNCLTIFSAPNYGDRCNNRGVVARLTSPEDGGPLKVEVRDFEPGPRPNCYVQAMFYAPTTMAAYMRMMRCVPKEFMILE